MLPHSFRRPLLLLLLLLTPAFGLSGQGRKIVSGRVTNSGDNNKNFDEIDIYAYSTIAEAEDAYRSWKRAWAQGSLFDPGLTVTTRPENGYYEINVAPTGALLFIYDSSEVEPKLIAVNNQLEINVSFNLAIQLEESIVSAGYGHKPIIDPPEIVGDTLSCGGTYQFPKERMARSTARLGVQPFILSANKVDTIEFRPPVVMDGKAYHQTQLRRMGFRADRDPLMLMAERNAELSDSTARITWRDKYKMESPDQRFYVKAIIWLEDYNQVYFRDSLQLADTRRVRRPMRFLEYDTQSYSLDPNKAEYKRNPRRERMENAKNLSLTFLTGKALLDPADTLGARQLEELEEEIRLVINSDETTLKEYHIYGVASPEGNYAQNLGLARQRLEFMASKISSLLPTEIRRRVYVETDSRVGKWSEVADILEADGLKEQADELRSIENQYPNNMDRQWGRVRTLPYYASEIAPRLPKLRSVRFEYNYELFRALTPQEVLTRFRTDMDYREGRKDFALYEYWNLFQLVEDPDELETLYRRAMSSAAKQGDEWLLPANLLAESYIRRGVTDTTLLAPFIDETKPCNQPWDNGKTTKNPDPIVANQVVMMLRSDQYTRAVELATILPREKYEMLYYIARCLAGYFKGSTPEDRRTYDIIKGSTPRNAVVMNMAMGYMPLAKIALDTMPDSDPAKHYLTAQYYCRKNYLENVTTFTFVDFDEQDTMIRELVESFKADPKYIDIAESDWDIFEDLFKEAKKEFENPIDELYL